MPPTSEPPSPAATDHVRLAEVWTELRAGKLKVVSAKSDEDEHLLVVRQAGLADDETPSPSLRLFEQSVVTGYRQVGFDMAMSPARVMSAVNDARIWLGLRSKSLLPPLLRFSILADQRGSLVTAARRFQRNFVLSLARPEARLRATLNPHEWQLLRLLVEGEPLAGIAERRRTATRVTANQIGHLWKRLGVRGKHELYLLVFDLLEADDAHVV